MPTGHPGRRRGRMREVVRGGLVGESGLTSTARSRVMAAGRESS